MRKYRVSRFRELIFPKELIIDKYHVLSRKRHFPAFWRVHEESIPLSKLASIQIHRGLLFSKVIIENSGGPFPIIVNGLWNPQAREARDLLEMIEREMTKSADERHVEHLVDDVEETRPSGGNPPDSPGSGDGGPEYDFPPPPPPPRASASDSAPINVVAPPPPPPPPPSPSKSDTQPPSAEWVTYVPQESTPREATSTLPHPPPPMQPPDSTYSDTTRHEIQSGRQFGETPESDWQPAAPWETMDVNDHGPVWEGGIREVDPVDFLNQSTAVAEPQSDEIREPASEKLVNWWESTKSQFGQNQESTGRKRKRRKLN